VPQADPCGRNASQSRRNELAQHGQLLQVSPMSSVDDESSIHFEERADLLFQGMRRPERAMSGPADPSLNKRKEKKTENSYEKHFKFSFPSN
jgi:hypothetical protein